MKTVDRARWMVAGEDLVSIVPPTGARIVVCFFGSVQGQLWSLRRKDVCVPGLSLFIASEFRADPDVGRWVYDCACDTMTLEIYTVNITMR